MGQCVARCGRGSHRHGHRHRHANGTAHGGGNGAAKPGRGPTLRGGGGRRSDAAAVNSEEAQNGGPARATAGTAATAGAGPKRRTSWLGDVVGGVVGGSCVGAGCPLGNAGEHGYGGGGGGGVQERRVEELFRRYRDEHEDAVLEEGVQRLCHDLGSEPADFTALVLAWKFNACTVCQFTRAEFFSGCRSMRADSIRSLRSRLPDLFSDLRHEDSFRDFYRYAFHLGLADADDGGAACRWGAAAELWRRVYARDAPPLLGLWLLFLGENPGGVRGVSRDTWLMFPSFAHAAGPDLAGYAEDEAWPSLFDAFAEWARGRDGQDRPRVAEGGDGGGGDGDAAGEGRDAEDEGGGKRERRGGRSCRSRGGEDARGAATPWACVERRSSAGEAAAQDG
uniref:DCN1-like protein n=1 Tax=Petromyzon marinus TaxID=7757 RepID=A0AAJ7U993_PETMA|nr:LOW QUALITY PROTEIN: DCN1-like protein 3 [Petromyzon marinus]